MRTSSIRRNLSILGACAVALGLGSCQEKNPVYDNPNDQLGENWSPPTVKVLDRLDTAGINDTVRISVTGADPDPEDRLDRVAWFSSYGERDTVRFDGDKAVAKYVTALAGRRVLHFRTCDNKGVWSIGTDSAVLDIRQYPPTATIKALKDSVEPGDSVKFAVAWTDTAPGNAVQYNWTAEGKDTATKDSIRTFRPKSPGEFTVSVTVTDDDGNVSPQTLAKVVVRPLVPWVDSVYCLKDAAEAGKKIRFVIKAHDNKPGRMARYYLTSASGVDSSSSDTVTVMAPSEGSMVVTAWVRDKDGNRSDAQSDRMLTIPVVVLRPSASIQAPDSGEINVPVTFTLSGKDADTGHVVKYVWKYGTDTATTTTTSPTRSYTMASVGTMSVTGWTVDSDGNRSLPVEKSVSILAHAPVIKPKFSEGADDTIRIGLGMSRTLGWTVTDAPTDPKGDSLKSVTWTTSDKRSGTGASVVFKDSLEKLVQVVVVATDRDNLKSTVSAWVRFVPTAPQITAPASDSFLPDTAVVVKWNAGYLDSIFEVYADTLPSPSKLRWTGAGTSTTLQLPFWNKTWHVKVVGKKGGSTASSAVRTFSIAERKSSRTQLASLSVAAFAGTQLQPDLGIAFSPNKTSYSIVVKPTVTSLDVTAAGDVEGQVINLDGTQFTVQAAAKSSTRKIDLAVTPRDITIAVKAAKDTAIRKYTIRVTKANPLGLVLDSLGFDNGFLLSPRYHPDSNLYTVGIPKGDSTTLRYDSTTLRNKGVASIVLTRAGKPATKVLHGTVQDSSQPLLVNVFIDKDTNTYQIKVRILPSRDARMQNLTFVPSLTPVPAFHQDSMSYLVQVPEGRDTVSFLPTLSPGQSMTANGSPVKLEQATPFKIGLGMTPLALVVTAADGKTRRTYNITFNRKASTRSWLTGIAVMNVPLSPAFDSTVFKYRVVLPYRQDTASVKYKGGAPLVSSIRINDVVTAANTYVPVQRLKAGDSVTYRIKVLAEDTTATTTYQVVVLRALPDTSRALSGLAVKTLKGRLVMSNAFTGPADTVLRGGTDYADSILEVTPSWVLANLRSVRSGSKILVSGKPDTLKLKANDTTVVSIVVTPEDSTRSRTYSIRIFRAAGSLNADLSALKWITNRITTPAFLPVSTDSVFDIAVPFSDTMVRVAPVVADSNALMVTIQGLVIAKGSSTAPIRLQVGEVTEIRTEVYAQNPERKKTYLMRVTRLAKSRDTALSSMTANTRTGSVSLALGRGDTTWLGSVAYEDSLIWIKPRARDTAAATVKVNGKVVAFGSKSDSIKLPIVADANTITVEVTAEDGATRQTYQVVIVRASPESNSYLASLVVAAGARSIDVTPVFTKTVSVYRAVVANSDSQITVSPASEDPGARSIRVNGELVATGAKSRLITLAAEDTTTLTIVVLAQDSLTTRTYEVKVFRKATEDVVVLSSIPTGTKLDRTYYPRLFVGPGVDTTGLLIRATVDGTVPSLVDTGLGSGAILQFGSPMTLRASAWRNGVQIGPVQTFQWLMDSCVYDFEEPDSGFYLWDAWRRSNNVPLDDSINYWTGLQGWRWTTTGSTVQPRVAAGTLGTGKSYQLDINLTGNSYPAAGIAIASPYAPMGARRGGKNYQSLKRIGLTMKRTYTSLALQYVHLVVSPDKDGDPTGYAAAVQGATYRSIIPVSSGSIKKITVDLSEFALEQWVLDEGIVTSSLEEQLRNFAGFEITQVCLTGVCSNAKASMEFDRLVYYFE